MPLIVYMESVLYGMALDVSYERCKIDSHSLEDIRRSQERSIEFEAIVYAIFHTTGQNRSMRPRLILGILVLMVAAACGTGAAVDDVAPAVSSTTSSTITTDPIATTHPSLVPDSAAPITLDPDTPIALELTTCENAREFAILCEAYQHLKNQYVDPLDDAVLAAGAVRGIEEFLEASAGRSDVLTVACPLPSEAFEETCEAATIALSTLETDILSVAEAAVFGLFEHGVDDPNSRYLSPPVLARISEEQTGTISGIGSLVLTEEDTEGGERVRCNVITETCRMFVISVIEGGPAEAAGLLSGDSMLTVDGKSLLGWTSEEIVAAVRGPEGEPVTIGIDRDGTTISFTIVRAPIVVPVTSTELFDGGVGYVELSQFTNNSDVLFRAALQELIDAGATKLIIDFQNNPGGALTAAISVASEFIDEGVVLITQSPDEDNTYPIKPGGVATSDELEIVVLVNRGSASASEVVAGVLQETRRAVIMGESTFGKNTVQQQYPLSNGGAVKVTIARWVTPSGADFDGDGVTPDIVFDIPNDANRDFLIDEALAYFGVLRPTP